MSKTGVLLFLAIYLTSHFVNAQRIFWSENNNGRIRVGTLGQSSITAPTTFISGLDNPRTVEVDQVNNTLYYSNFGNEDIRSSNLTTGAFIWDVITTGAMAGYYDFAFSDNGGGVFAVGIDEVEGLYYIPWDNNDSGNGVGLNLGPLTNDVFGSVVVDDGNEYVYIAGLYDGTIYRTGFGGGTPTEMAVLSTIRDMAYDRFNNHLYIINETTQYELYRLDLDDGSLTQLFNLGSTDIECVEVYPQVGKVYFSRYNTGIFSVNMDGTGSPVQEISLTGVGSILFDIEEDQTPPVFLTLSPANNAIDVPTTPTLVMTFDENVNVSTTGAPANELSIRIMRLSDNAVHQTIARTSGDISIVNNTVTISGITGLEPNTEYYVLIGNRVVSDLASNNFVGIATNAGWRFRTAPGVVLSPPGQAVCENSFVTLPDIAITEAHDSNIKPGTLVTVILTFSGAGYEFNPGEGTSGHLIGRSITSSSLSVTATQATLTFTAAPGVFPNDAITISGLQVRSSNGANPPADIIRSGGTALIDGLVNGTVIASVTSQPAPAAPTLSYPDGDLFCIGADVSGAIVNATGTGLKWYSDVDLTTEIAALAGLTSATGPQLAVSSASAQVFNAYVVQTSGNCPSPAATVTVTIDPGPQLIETNSVDQTSCVAPPNGIAEVVDVNDEGLTNYAISWFDGGMNPVGSPGADLSAVDAGTYNAEVRSLITGCTNLAVVTVGDGRVTPVVTTGSTDNTHCLVPNGSATATIQNPIGPVSEYGFTWYAGPDTGSPMISTDETAANIGPGTYSVVVEHSATGCASAVTTTTVDDATAPPGFSIPTAEVCETVFQSGTATVDLTTFNALITAGDPSLVVTWLDNLSNPITSADVSSGTVISFEVQSSVTGCKASASVTFAVFTQPTPADAGTDQTVCGASVTLAANMPIFGIGNWTITGGPPGGSFSDPSANNTVFTGTPGNTYELQWATYHAAQCPQSVATVNITLAAPPTTANAGLSQFVCEGPIVLAGNTPVVGAGAWSIVSGTGGSFSDASLPNTTFTGSAGTYTLRWTISSAGCTPSESDIDITLTAPPTPAVAGDDIVSCATQVTLGANTPTVGSGTWMVISGIGGSFGDSADPSSTFTGVTGTTYTLRWTTTNGLCTPSGDELSVVFNSAPSTASAGFDLELCGNSTTLSGNVPTSGTGNWTIVAGTGGSFGDAGLATTTFTGTAGVVYTLRWTISAGPDCPPSEDDVTITFVAPPTTAIAGDDVSICAASVALSGNVPATGTGEWSVVSGAGGNFSSTSAPTAMFSGVVNTTYELRWTISNGVCPASSDDVTITLIDPPSVAQAGADQSLCANAVTLNANTPTTGTGNWSIVSGIGGSFSSPSSATGTFSGLPGTTYTLRWTIARAGCTPNTDDVVVDLKGVPQGTGVLSALPPICEGTEATLELTGVSHATFYNWVVPAGITILSQSDASARIRVNAGPGGPITVTPLNECGAAPETNGDITILAAPPLTIDLPSSPFIEVPVQFMFSSPATIASASWDFGDGGTADGTIVEHMFGASGSYNISLTAVSDNGCENSTSTTFVVLGEPELGDLAIKNVITANGDESNAYLYIVNIDRYPENEVRFLDRWGVEVFSARNYNNDWDARNKHGDFLPAGQYICIVKLNSTGKVFSRTVSIIKSR